MKKVYLLITAALLLLSSSAFAKVIAMVGDQGFDTDDYSSYPYASALNAALAASSETDPAVVQTDFWLDAYFGYTGYLDLNGKTINSYYSMFQVKNGTLNIDGEGILNYYGGSSAIWVIGSKKDEANYSVVNIGKDVTIDCKGDGYAISIDRVTRINDKGKTVTDGITVIRNGAEKKNVGASLGVVVNVNGTLNAPYIMTINGNTQVVAGDLIEGVTVVNLPTINISKTAKLTTTIDDDAIYAAGYGIWNINGTITGGTGIYAKSGIFNISDATITATGGFAAPNINNNGGDPTGDAIILDANKNYAGNIVLNITNSELTSSNGYAVQEALTNKTTTNANAFYIDDKSSFAGTLGSIHLSDDFHKALVDGVNSSGDWVDNGVKGGKYSAKPEIVADGYEVVELPNSYPFLYGVVAKTQTSYESETIEAGTYEEKTVTRGKELVIKYGRTVTIGTLTIGDEASYPARVRVEAGGVLIVGNIIFNNNKGVESLLLEADGIHGTGVLLFNDNTLVQPLGSVELYAKCRALDQTSKIYSFQHFGIPMFSEGSSIEKNAQVAYATWNLRNGWQKTSSDVVLSNGPWSGANFTANTSYAGSILKFSGNLVGNADANFGLASSEYGYKCFANSYTAPMSMAEFIMAAKDVKGFDGTIWVYDTDAKGFGQYVYAEASEDELGIAPMQAFFMSHLSSSDDAFTFNYNAGVKDFYTESGTAKAADATVENKGKITISDGNSTATLSLYEGESFSDEFDWGYDGYQMETGDIKIYIAQADKNYSSFATNSFDGKEITIVSQNATDITMSFSKLGGKAFKLTDKASGSEVEVGSESTYRFTVAPNSTVVRFTLGEGEVAANEAESDSAINVWLANNILNISGAAEGDAIEVINLAGVKVLSAIATADAIQMISFSGIASGAYIVKVGTTTVKVIK